jgi:RsiW-degrading membrane proteinase PrsW (M82 family)
MTTDILIFALSLLPGIAWLFFYLQEDCHPEPKWLLFLVFCGGIVSALVAYTAQDVIGPWLQGQGIQFYSLTSLTVYAVTEEFAKFFLVWLIIHKNREFDEPIDAMIYMVVAALGFATLENLGAIMDKDGSGFVEIGKAVETTSLRMVGATLLHTLTSGLIGYYWAKAIRAFNTNRYLLTGVGLATALHACFNYLIISYGELSYALLFVLIVGFFILSDFEKLREKTV